MANKGPVKWVLPQICASIDDPPSASLNDVRWHGKRLDRYETKRAVGEYRLTQTLGSGATGKVKLAVHKADPHKKVTTREKECNDRKIDCPKKLAVKMIPRKDKKEEVRILREANLLSLLHHPYIVNLAGPVEVDRDYYYLLMEYVSGGQLLDYIISHGKLYEKHARRFARQIMSALGKPGKRGRGTRDGRWLNKRAVESIDYCHRNSIVHRGKKKTFMHREQWGYLLTS